MEVSETRSEQSDHNVENAETSSPCSSKSGTFSDDSSEKTLSSFPALGSAGEAFIQAGLNLTTVTELTQAVEKCKEMVLDTKEYSEERKWLVRYLIELRLRLEEAREAEACQRKLEPMGTPDLSPSKDSPVFYEGDLLKKREKRIILGHHFVLQAPTRDILKCDRCGRNMWVVVHFWYECSDCQYKCHIKCLERIKRQCAFVRVCETPFYINDICPEIGLAAQKYCCHECKSLISPKRTWCEPRQCDYDGQYYCSNCHWDYEAIIPARVIHNWDFTEKKVCCNCFSFLRLMLNKPVINLDTLNPQLFQFVDDLAASKKLRSQFLLMKQYLTRCPDVLKEKNRRKLIWSLSSHLIQNPSGIFSLQDLINIYNKSFLPVLKEVSQISSHHIRNCLVCKLKGYFCELCLPRKEEVDESASKNQKCDDVLFPFDDAVSVFVCSKCSSVFHRDCWMKRGFGTCRRCERLEERRSLLNEPID